MSDSFQISRRIKSFKYAFNGIFILLKSQHNAWIHAVATILVVTIGFILGFTKTEWCWIVVAILLVWITEAINTAFEFLADAVSPDHHPLVGKAKDVAAGAVLIAAIGAVVIGVLVIKPYIKHLL